MCAHQAPAEKLTDEERLPPRQVQWFMRPTRIGAARAAGRGHDESYARMVDIYRLRCALQREGVVT